MRINGFDWDEQNLGHAGKHGIRDYEAEEAILFGNPIFQRSRNNTYVAFGVTQDGRYLLVVFVVKGYGIIRVITARDMTDREKHNYRKRRCCNMKKRKKIPKFKSEKEAAEFWSTHSPLDYPDEFKEVKKPFQFDVSFLKKMAKEHKEKKKTLTLRMEESQILLAKIIANRLGDYYQSLIRDWVREGIVRKLEEHPEIGEYIRKKQMHLLKV